MKTIVTAASCGELDRVREFVDAELEACDCSFKLTYQLELVVEEVFVNIASYAYPTEPGTAEVSVGVEGTPPTITLVFRDAGVPVDPVAQKEADTSPDALQSRVGGLGIFLVKKTMDEVRYAYENGHNVLTLKKKLLP